MTVHELIALLSEFDPTTEVQFRMVRDQDSAGLLTDGDGAPIISLTREGSV